MKTIEQKAQELRKEFNSKYGSGSNLRAGDVAVRIEQTFIEGAKYAQQWISVEDKLPERSEFEKYGPLLVLDRYGNYFVAFFREKYKVFGTDNPNYSHVIGEVAFVTHWRPIELK